MSRTAYEGLRPASADQAEDEQDGQDDETTAAPADGRVMRLAAMGLVIFKLPPELHGDAQTDAGPCFGSG